MDEYRRLAHERWLRSQTNRGGDTSQTHTTVIHTATPTVLPRNELESSSSSLYSSSSLASTSCSRKSSGATACPALSSGTALSSSSSFPLSSSASSSASSLSSTASEITDLTNIPDSPIPPRSNLYSENRNFVAKEFNDTSGDLELAQRLAQQENKELEQTRKDEALARKLQETIDRDAELAMRMMEEEISAQEREQDYHYAEADSNSDSEEDAFQRQPGSRHSLRRVPNLSGVNFAQLLHQIANIQQPDFGEMDDVHNRRRVHFADFDEYIRQTLGTEHRGTPIAPEVIRQLPTRKYKKPTGAIAEQQNCSICLGEFEEGDAIRSLPCFHGFHEQEIDQWLSTNNTCPICKTIVKL